MPFLGGVELPIPRRVGEIDARWLSRCLAASDFLAGHPVCSLRCETLGAGRGFMGETYRLHFRVEAGDVGEDTSLILKLPARERGTRARAELLGLYEREILFYRELAGELPISLPRCYHAAMDPNPSGPGATRDAERTLARMPPWRLRVLLGLGLALVRLSRRRYVLLLEDLRGGVSGDQLVGRAPVPLAEILAELARLHAGYWESPRIASVAWLPELESGAQLVRAWYRRSRSAFLHRFGHALPGSVRELLDDIDRGLPGLLAPLSASPKTLLHGDFRLDNLVFDAAAAESRVSFLDWQAPLRGVGVYDVVYLLSSSLGPEVTREEEIALLRAYHGALEAGGVRGYAFEDCLADYGRCLLLALHRMASSVVSVDTANPRGEALMESWVTRMLARVERAGREALARALKPDAQRRASRVGGSRC